MSNFSELFFESRGEPVEYKGQTLVLSDKFPVRNGDTIIASIEKTSGDCRQGLCIDIVGQCECNGKVFNQGKRVRMHFWEDTAPKQIKLKIFTDKGFVRIENIWEQTNHYLADGSKFSKSIEARTNGAAMIVEEIENGRRYRCNDGKPDEDFDDIVFTITKEPK